MNEAITSNPPFEQIEPHLSDKPLRRPRRRVNAKGLNNIAKKNPPPQEWYDGNEPKPFREPNT